MTEFDWQTACFDAERRIVDAGRVMLKLAEALSARPPWKGTPPDEIVRIFEEAVRRDVDAD